MNFDTTLLLCMFGVLAIASAVLFLPPMARRSARAQRKQVGLELPEDVRPVVERRLRRNQIGGAIGLLTVAGLAVWAQAAAGSPPGSAFFLAIGAWSGLSLGTAIAAATGRRAPTGDAPRFTRARETTVEDYVPPRTMLVARVAGAVGILFTGTLLVVVLAVEPALAAGPASSLGLTVLAVAALELGGRRIARAPRRAISPADLAWDDAMRGQSLQQLTTAPLIVGIFSASSGMQLVARLIDPTGVVLATMAISMLMIVAAVVAVIANAAADPGRHYLRRLWPDLARPGVQRPVAVGPAGGAEPAEREDAG